MASQDKLLCVHQNLGWLSGAGSLTTLLGISGFFMLNEFPKRQAKAWNHWHLPIMVVYVSGLILLVLSMSLWPDERENEGETVADLINQLRKRKAQPKINEHALLAALSALVVVTGSFMTAKNWRNTRKLGFFGALLS